MISDICSDDCRNQSIEWERIGGFLHGVNQLLNDKRKFWPLYYSHNEATYTHFHVFDFYLAK